MTQKIDEFTAREIAGYLEDHGYDEAGLRVSFYIDMFIKHDPVKVNQIKANNPQHTDN